MTVDRNQAKQASDLILKERDVDIHYLPPSLNEHAQYKASKCRKVLDDVKKSIDAGLRTKKTVKVIVCTYVQR